MRQSRRFLWALALCLAAASAGAYTLYSTVYNHFAPLAVPAGVDTAHNCLLIDNATDTALIVPDSTLLTTMSYRYQARMANLHNAEGKSYAVTDAQGRKSRVQSPAWGVVFNMTSPADYDAALVFCTNRSLYHDVADSRTMTVQLLRVTQGKPNVVKECQIDKGADMGDDFNTVCIDVTEGEVSILVGERRLKPVFTAQLPRPRGGVRAGCLIGSGAQVMLERAVLSYKENGLMQVATPWTREALDAHFAQSRNPYEGYWTYLDRDMEDKWLRLGGRYVLALVETPAGYDLIYMDGAQVCGDKWKAGMLKGRLSKAIFTDHFQGLWVDATFRPIEQDVNANFDNGVILTLKFPVYKSQIRLSKVVDK